MSMSLDFCITTASNPLRSGYSDRNWNKAKEVESEPFFDTIFIGGIAMKWSEAKDKAKEKYGLS